MNIQELLVYSLKMPKKSSIINIKWISKFNETVYISNFVVSFSVIVSTFKCFDICLFFCFCFFFFRIFIKLQVSSFLYLKNFADKGKARVTTLRFRPHKYHLKVHASGTWFERRKLWIFKIMKYLVFIIFYCSSYASLTMIYGTIAESPLSYNVSISFKGRGDMYTGATINRVITR